ncbi:glutaminase [Nocardioides alcanivorans]|uniref:glutaminase n=1 Tax=Nocardioides alcanivorans TaxID=2897352 RepID=UPI001F000FDA|nr:glutaminase [Nocardioides alcanivorans]
MKSPIPDYLSGIMDSCAADVSGERAAYIPELAAADPDRLAVALCTVDGVVYAVGDADAEFTIQSISKPFVYALALAERGFSSTLDKVGVEPSGDAFNDFSLEPDTGRPRNPMINAGAIATHSLIGEPGAGAEERQERVLAGLSAFAGRRLEVDERVFASELETAHRNLALAHMLRSYGIIEDDPVEVVRGYTRQCSVLVTVRDLAVMAATLANGGRHPTTDVQVISARVARQVLSVMTTSGMYDAAGDWVTTVGIPAKSGVAGGLLGALPGQVGVATFSPRLDKHGHSVRGVQLFRRLTDDMGMHLMEIPSPGQAVLRKVRTFDGPHGSSMVFQLQGRLGFTTAEVVAREVVEQAPTTDRVIFDVELLYKVEEVGRVMLLEVCRRLSLEGREVILLDSEGVLPNPVPGSGATLKVVTSREELIGLASADQ